MLNRSATRHFSSGVDREACALYKQALDQFLPPEYSEVVYTGNHNDSVLLKKFHLDPKRERQIRKSFGKLDLKVLFKNKMESKAPEYLSLIERNFTDKDVDTLIEHFRDPERRKMFFKEYKEIEMLYEIISPDAFLRPFIEEYATLSAIYVVVRKAYTKRIQVDREFQRKTNKLVQDQIGSYGIGEVERVVRIDAETIDIINAQTGGEATKVINLIKSIGKIAADESEDPFLIAMAERAQAVQESFESRQTTTAEALEKLMQEVEANEARKREQAEKGFDGLTFFVYRTLLDEKIGNAEEVSRQIKGAFLEFPNWQKSDAALRELRKKITFALYAQSEELDRVTGIVDYLFHLLQKANRI